MIRFLDAAGLAQPIYAVEVQGHFYATAELEHIISAALAWQEAIEACNGVYAAEQALLAALGERKPNGPDACALCCAPITQKRRGRRRKYCDGCAARLGHRTSGLSLRKIGAEKATG